MVSARKTPQGGFTLIELVVVIVILGILAAFAIPRFANIAHDARVSALNGMAGSLRSTSALVHGMSLARNLPGGPLTLEGTSVAIVNSYPAASPAGIVAALTVLDSATYAVLPAVGGVLTITVSGAATPATVSAAPPAGCSVSYSEPPNPGESAVVTISASLATDC